MNSTNELFFVFFSSDALKKKQEKAVIWSKDAYKYNISLSQIPMPLNGFTYGRFKGGMHATLPLLVITESLLLIDPW